jgi:hypothetical protein
MSDLVSRETECMAAISQSIPAWPVVILAGLHVDDGGCHGDRTSNAGLLVSSGMSALP